MMPHFNNVPYNRLFQLVKSGKLEIVYLFSLPRTCGTIVERALAQDPTVSGQMHEPFVHQDMQPWRANDEPNNAEEYFISGCNRILKYVRELQENSSEQKIKLVIKDHTSVFTKALFNKVLALCKDVIFIIREPKRNLKSLLTNTANHMLSEKGGLPADVIKVILSSDVKQLDNELSQLFGVEKGQISKKKLAELVDKKEGQDIDKNDLANALTKIYEGARGWFDVSWENLLPYFSIALENNKNLIILDGHFFQTMPRECIRVTCEKLVGIIYNDDMILNLSRFLGINDFTNCAGQAFGKEFITGVWLDMAVNSKTIQSQKIQPVHKAELPQQFNDSIDRAESIYIEIQGKQQAHLVMPAHTAKVELV